MKRFHSESLIAGVVLHETSRRSRNMKIVLVLSLCAALAVADEVALQEFTNGNNLFTAAIYKEALKDSPGNFLVSPLSIETVLALTQSGAKAETAEEIRSSLRLPSTTEKTKSAFKALLPALKGNEYYALHSANKIYVRSGLPLNERFKNIASNVYQSGFESLDFSLKVQAADAINSWVEKQTNGKIRSLIDPENLGTDTALVLVNALYFKGKWVFPFEKFATIKKNFYKSATDVVQVDTMHNTDLFNYYESAELNAKFLELPYEGGNVAMVVVLPNEVGGLASLENQLEKVFAAPKFTHERVSVALPKFTIENKVKLNEILKRLGVIQAFSDNADFSGIAGAPGDLKISQVVQKAFINVTEAGTEAAAATAVVGVDRIGVVGPDLVYEFIADHPFLFYIVRGNVVLFAGRLATC